MTVTTLMTADELLQMPDDGHRYELVRGELRKMSPAGSDHGRIAMLIGVSLFQHVKGERLGTVYAAETGFRIARNPDTVLAPDAAFVRAERDVKTPKYCEGAPDIAVEVVSSNDRYTEVDAKAKEWLRAGTRAVVVVDPQQQSVRVYRGPQGTEVTEAITLDDILPGWRLPLAELFE